MGGHPAGITVDAVREQLAALGHDDVSDDDNSGGPEAHDPDADDGGCEQKHLSRKVSIDKNRQMNRNKVSHEDQPRITS